MDPPDQDSALADYLATLTPEEREQFRDLIEEAQNCEARIRDGQQRTRQTISRSRDVEHQLDDSVSDIRDLMRSLQNALRDLRTPSTQRRQPN